MSSKIVAIAHYQGKGHAKRKKKEGGETGPVRDASGNFGIGLTFTKGAAAAAATTKSKRGGGGKQQQQQKKRSQVKGRKKKDLAFFKSF